MVPIELFIEIFHFNMYDWNMVYSKQEFYKILTDTRILYLPSI